jgi:hypothetical protein
MSAHAAAPVRCSIAVEDAQTVNHAKVLPKPFRFTSFEGTYTEMNPWYGDWSHGSTDGAEVNLRRDTEHEMVVISGVLDDSLSKTSAVEMKTPRMGGPDTARPFSSGNKGRGLVLTIETSEPGLDVELRLVGMTRQDTLRKVPAAPYSALAKIQSTGGSQKVMIPWEDFKLESKVTNAWDENKIPNRIDPSRHGSRSDAKIVEYEIGDAFYPPAFDNHALNFRVTRGASSQPGHRSFTLKIKGPIYRDFDLNWAAHDLKLALHNALRIGANNYDAPLGITRLDTFELYAHRIMQKGAQDFAFGVIAKGEDFVKRELARHGVTLREIDEKITDELFFNNTEAFHGIFPTRVPALPVENAAFALRHGRWTHVGQYLAATYGLEPGSLQLQEMNNLFTLGFGDNGAWRPVWNIFMDAPGDTTPNMVFWWTNEFKKRGIPLL